MYRVFLLYVTVLFSIFTAPVWGSEKAGASLVTDTSFIISNEDTQPSTKEREIIKVAVILPLTGKSADSGQSLKKALPLIEGLNEEKRFNREFHRKYDFKTILYDDACDPGKARRVANDIVANGDIRFVIGHYCSSATEAAAEIYKDQGILQISPFSTASNLTEQDFSHFFRLAGRNDTQAEEAGRRMTEFDSGRKIGLIYGKSNYGRDLTARVKNVLRRENVFPRLSIDLEERDAREVARDLINNNIKVVYYGGYYEDLIEILKAVDEAGKKIHFFSADSMQNRQFWEEAGPLASNVLFTLTLDYSRDVSDRRKNQLENIRRKDEQARVRGNRASIQALSGQFSVKDRAFQNRARFMRAYYTYYDYFPDLYALQLYAAYQIIKTIALDDSKRMGLVTATDYEGEGEDEVTLSRYSSSQEWAKEVSISIRDMGNNPYSDYTGFETVVGAVNFNASGEWSNAKYHIYKWVNEREDRTWLAETIEDEDKFMGRMGDFTRIF